MRLGTKIDGEFAGCGFDNFFLRGAGFDGDGVFVHFFIIALLVRLQDIDVEVGMPDG